MSEAIKEKISLFSSQLESRIFNGGTLQILESVLVTKDVRSLVEIRSALQECLRSNAMSVMIEIADKAVDLKLCTVEFFVQAFALVGDVKSCLALKYEALVLRETNYTNNHGLQVSYEEWFTFAKDSLCNGFYTIAVKGFESALLCVQSNVDPEFDTILLKEHTTDKIKELRDMAAALISSNSVQSQSAEYLKQKAIREVRKCSLCSSNSEHVASTMFRNGIRRRNMQKLIQSRGLLRDVVGP